MFEYFPRNYVWSMAVMLAAEHGGRMSEIDDACRPLQPLAANPDAAAQAAWSRSWCDIAARVERIAGDDEAAGRAFSAGEKLHRAGLYRFVAERMMRHTDAARLVVYRAMLDDFSRAVALCGDPVRRVAVPFEGSTLPALFVGPANAARQPCMVVFDGFDVMKEFTVWTGLPRALNRRGVSALVVDHPGVGEALRLQGLTGFHDTERPATASFDFLAARSDVDAARIGLMAPSAGGYYAARALAFEPRFACGVLWTGVWDWGAVVEKRLAGALAQSVSFMAEHAQWVFGAADMAALRATLAKMNLPAGGVAERIACPLLVTHGERDRQTPLAEAQRVFGAVATHKELKVFSAADGGAEHCQIDNTPIGVDYMADWVAGVLGGTRGPAPLQQETTR